MSATDSTWLSGDYDLPAWSLRRKRWWTRVASRCAGPNCPRMNKLWPAWLRTSAGLEFDGRWYCGRQCFEPVLASRVHSLLASFHLERQRTHRFPIGLLLVNRHVISAAQLREAIHLQREAGHGRLGDWLRQTASLSAEQLTAALGQQWGCPVFPLDDQAVPVTWSDLIPLPVLEAAAAVPAHASPDGRVLHLAFSERIDHTLLYAVEQMVLCRTFPSVAPAPAVQMRLEQLRRFSSGNSTCFDTVRESPEMTWTICNYATELGAARVVLARAGAFVWVRFFRTGPARDLLFRVLPESQTNPLKQSSVRTKASAIAADGRKGGVSDASLPL
jgi:hypothetical protein